MDWLSIKEFLKDSVKAIIFIVVVLFLMIYVVSITQVVGNSMSPNYQNGEILVLNKFKYRFFKIKRGDIVSLKYANTKYLIKRVIGLPGDTIYIKNNILYINNQEYKEDYIKGLNYDDFNLTDLGYTTIPENMYFVLGDNRSDSIDSREIGLVKKEDIIGKASIRIWPLNKFKFI